MADDEAFMHDFAKNALGKDWRVVDCKTVGEVVDVVNKLESRESRERERVSVALLDYLLPQGDGRENHLSTGELVKFLQERGIKVGIITGWPVGEVKNELRVPVFDKLEVASGYHQGLREVVRMVQGESMGKGAVEKE